MTSIAEGMLVVYDDLEEDMLPPDKVAGVARAAADNDLDPAAHSNAEADYIAAADTAQT